MIQLLQYLGEDLTAAMGWTFLHSIWQGGLIALVMFVVLQMIPEKRAILRYNIAALSMLGMLILAMLTFSLMFNAGGTPDPVVVTGTTAAGISTGASSIPAISPVRAFLVANLPFFVALWFLGMLVFATKLAVGMLYVRRLRGSMQDLAVHWQEQLGVLSGRIGHTAVIRIAESALIKVPVAFGYLKPVILFPIGTINRLSPEQVEAILAHELAHIVRKDYLQNFIQSIIEVVFYYHPAVWFISAVVRNERENCCDDLAIQACGNSLTYAKALVELEEMQQRTPSLALAFSGSKHQLLNRIKRILNQPQHKSHIMEKLITTILLLCCIFLFSFNYTNTPASSEEHPGEANTGEQMVVELALSEVVHFDQEIDTIPKKGTIRIKKSTDDKMVEMTMKNGEIEELKIDGGRNPS